MQLSEIISALLNKQVKYKTVFYIIQRFSLFFFLFGDYINRPETRENYRSLRTITLQVRQPYE